MMPSRDNTILPPLSTRLIITLPILSMSRIVRHRFCLASLYGPLGLDCPR